MLKLIKSSKYYIIFVSKFIKFRKPICFQNNDSDELDLDKMGK